MNTPTYKQSFIGFGSSDATMCSTKPAYNPQSFIGFNSGSGSGGATTCSTNPKIPTTPAAICYKQSFIGFGSGGATTCATTSPPTIFSTTTNVVPTAVQFSLSEEQEEVCRLILQQTNTSVIAKAGSGKTTASLEIARRYYTTYHTRTLLLTYNSRLKQETRERVRALNLSPVVDAHSYHAAATCLFGSNGSSDDTLISTALQNHPLSGVLEYGLIIVDESQDLTPLYYRFLIHILTHSRTKPVLLMLGDPFQRIFGFSNSTVDYLLEPEVYFKPWVCNNNKSVPFALRHFTICWRITHEMAEWINENMNPLSLRFSNPTWWKTHGKQIEAWWGAGIRADPNKPPHPNSVEYIHADNHELTRIIGELFKTYNGSEIALLCFSLNSEKSPMRRVVDTFGLKESENWLIMNGESQYSPTDSVFKMKRVASTIHKFKGLERKAIVVFGMDSWIESKCKSNPIDHFNINYVACTRAKQKLIVSRPNLPCFFQSLEYVTIRKTLNSEEVQPSLKTISVTELLDYVPYNEILSEPTLFLTTPTYDHIEQNVPFSSCLRYIEGRSKGTVEDISPIIGTAVHTKLSILLGYTPTSLGIQAGIADVDLIEWLHDLYDIPSTKWTWGQILTYSAAHQTLRTGFMCYWRQLNHYTCKPSPELVLFMEKSLQNTVQILYDLASDKRLIRSNISTFSLKNMIKVLKPVVSVEVPVNFIFPVSWWTDLYEFNISGSIDIILGNKYIVELKVSDARQSHQHALQVQLYNSITYLETRKKLTSYVLIANQAYLYQVDLQLQKSCATVSVDKEFMYRILKRRAKQQFTTSKEMIQDYKTRAKYVNNSKQ